MNKFIPVLLIAVAVIVGSIAWLNVSRDDPDASVSTSVQQEPPLPKGHLNEPEVTRLSEATAYAAQLKGVAAETHSLRKDVSEFYGSTDKKIADAAQKALQGSDCIPMEFTGRAMKDYVFVLESGIRDQKSLENWIHLCLDYNPKAKKSKK